MRITLSLATQKKPIEQTASRRQEQNMLNVNHIRRRSIMTACADILLLFGLLPHSLHL